MVGSACQCPNDLYTCDLALGCICPEGVDCGLEVIELSFSGKSDNFNLFL